MTTGWIFDIILCENSINQSINQSIISLLCQKSSPWSQKVEKHHPAWKNVQPSLYSERKRQKIENGTKILGKRSASTYYKLPKSKFQHPVSSIPYNTGFCPCLVEQRRSCPLLSLGAESHGCSGITLHWLTYHSDHSVPPAVQIQAEIQGVSLALRESTKNLCRNLKDSPNISGNLLKIEGERTELSNLLNATCREIAKVCRTNCCMDLFRYTMLLIIV